MKKILIYLLILGSSSLWAQETPTTTLYLIRHAEKATTSNDPELSEAGIKRALFWASYFTKEPIDVFYATATQRTQQTIAGIAAVHYKEVKTYQPGAFALQDLVANHNGKTILVVGHSNSIPKHINAFLGTETYPQIDETEFGHLYKITVKGSEIQHHLTQLN